MAKSTKSSSSSKDLEQKVAKLEEQWKRALADYANLEKRISREKESQTKLANEALVDKLLFVFDDLERACKNLPEPGLAIIKDQFWQVLAGEGIERIITQGKTFDPQSMDAEAMVPGPKNKIVEEICAGYTYRGRCLRPAKVKVGQGKNNS
jgi:molecular chaperone GrpE